MGSRCDIGKPSTKFESFDLFIFSHLVKHFFLNSHQTVEWISLDLTAQRDVNASTEVSAIHAMDAAPVSMVGSDRAVERVYLLLVIKKKTFTFYSKLM